MEEKLKIEIDLNVRWKDNPSEYNKAYRIKNKEKLIVKSKEYYQNNKEKIKEQQLSVADSIKIRNKQYTIKNKEKNARRYLRDKDRLKQLNLEWQKNNVTKIKAKTKEYRSKTKKIRNKSIKERCSIDPVFKLSRLIRSTIRAIFNKKSIVKNSKTEVILGCSFLEFKNYLESKFESWMTWENYGKWNGELNYGWDIDHIIPLASAKCEEDVLKLNHYTNLQPLCSHTNRYIKRDKIEYDAAPTV